MINHVRDFKSVQKASHTLVQIKFVFSIIKIILLICIYFTYDENIFSGLSLSDERLNENYLKARAMYQYFILHSLLSGLTFFAIFLVGDLILQIIGITYNFKKNNVICNILLLTLASSLHIFSVFLLIYFILDNWHYVTIWYIFITSE
jgi:hypothetical protein